MLTWVLQLEPVYSEVAAALRRLLLSAASAAPRAVAPGEQGGCSTASTKQMALVGIRPAPAAPRASPGCQPLHRRPGRRAQRRPERLGLGYQAGSALEGEVGGGAPGAKTPW